MSVRPRLADTLEALVSERTDIHADKPTFTTVMDGTPVVLRAIFGDTEDQRHKSGELTGETGARKSQNRIAPTDDVVAVQCRLEVQR